MSVPKKVTFTARARVRSAGEAATLDATFGLYGTLTATALSGLARSETPPEIEARLRDTHGVNRRLARSAITTAQGMREAVVAGAAARLVGADERLARLDTRIAQARARDPRRLPGLHHRRDRLAARAARDRELVAGSRQPGVCLGGSVLARERHRLTTDDEVEDWQRRWASARTSQVLFAGDRDRTLGNNDCKLQLDTPDGDVLVMRVPEALRVQTGCPTVTLSLKGLDYARERLRAALALDWAHLRARQAAFDTGQAARKGGSVATRRPTERDVATTSPVSIRIHRCRDGVLRVAVTVDRVPATRISSPRHGAVGIDVNPDHLAVCRVDASGNPVAWRRIDLLTESTSGQRTARIRDAVDEAIVLAGANPDRGWEPVPVVTEKLNFGYARQNLRYLPARLARQLSAFAYRVILDAVAVRCANTGLQLITVNPAFTSQLGQANYSSSQGVSVDLAAACCIARRGKRLHETVRPGVLRTAPADAVLGNPGPARKRHGLCVRLPKRSETQKTSWLARQATAPTGPVPVTRQSMTSLGFAAKPARPASITLTSMQPGKSDQMANTGQLA